jgi:hypothetical protein
VATNPSEFLELDIFAKEYFGELILRYFSLNSATLKR